MATALASSIRSVRLSSDEYVYRPVAVAIDFGTSSSGYAFAFKEQGTEKLKAPVLNKWQMGSASSSTDKTPTCLLLKPDKTFDSFGYTAEDKYSRLCDTKKQRGWWYFEKFKMLLYQTKKLSRNVTIKDAEDKSMTAHEVFVHVIAHLKARILNEVRAQNSDIKEDGIQYVMTVPAIWSDAAKQFMREAATDPRVGIKDEQVRLVLEPEAASVYCRYTLSRAIDRPDGSVELTSLPVGHKYIIADLGGGTVDIATHEVVEHDKLHEIHVARGDDLGGQMFNLQFLELLESLFGHELFSKWKRSESGDYLLLLRTIEGLKWEITQSEGDVLLRIESSLMDIIREDTGEGLDRLVSRSAYKTSIDVVGKGKLSLSNGLIRGFFRKTLKGVEEHVRAITDEHDDIGTIFLVGGLAKAPYIRDFIRARFPGQRLIAPEDPGVAVLRGAILLGDKPQTIAGRIARYSYGVDVADLFKQGVHREDYRVTRDGKDRCDHVFEKLIEKGQVLKYGQTFETITAIYAKQPETKTQTFGTALYQSTQASPMYVTDEGCTQLGKIRESPPEGGWPDYCENTVQIIVGEAEFKLHVKLLDKTYEQKIDFLFQ